MEKVILNLSLFCVLAFASCSKSSDDASTDITPSGTVTDCGTKTGVAKVVCLAENFKATLSASQITTLQLEYNATNAKKWSNLPVTMVPRVGIRLGDLSATQLTAAKALLKEVTGSTANEGYDEINQLWLADDYLSTNGGGTSYGAGQYYIAFLGAPSTTATWQLQSGGHHLAVANTYINGVLKGATPSFRAVEPFAAFGSNYQPILQERDALAAMFTGLSANELATAKLSSTFSDILLGPGKDGQFPNAKSGLKVGNLTNAQKTLVLNAIRTYVNDIDDTNAAAIMAKYSAEIDDTYIAYAGNANLTVQNDYVRIDGTSVWIEYSVQGGIVIRNTPHPHSVWRDRTGDYGGSF